MERSVVDELKAALGNVVAHVSAVIAGLLSVYVSATIIGGVCIAWLATMRAIWRVFF